MDSHILITLSKPVNNLSRKFQKASYSVLLITPGGLGWGQMSLDMLFFEKFQWFIFSSLDFISSELEALYVIRM